VPRAKYTKPPGPFLAIAQINQSKFVFHNEEWQKLTKLLPTKLGLDVRSNAAARLLVTLGYPPDATLPNKVKTFADLVIQATEDEINSHLTISQLNSEAPVNPANVRAAIHRLRYSLRPFVRGWVDDETAGIVDWAELDAKLATRDQEIVKLRLPSAKQRVLARLCQTIEVWVRHVCTANGETVSERDMLRYVDAALTFAGIGHPSFAKHRKRLAALVFPKD
jgi:hypothetical protein